MVSLGWKRLAPMMAGATALVAASAASAQSEGEMGRLDAEAQRLDSQDYPYVKTVCTVCHTPEMFLRVRSWQEWRGLFHDMVSYGARGSDEQWSHIYAYFLRTLTAINVNEAREEELMGVLQVDENTAISIIRQRPLRTAAELKLIAGVKASVVDALDGESRLEF